MPNRILRTIPKIPFELLISLHLQPGRILHRPQRPHGGGIIPLASEAGELDHDVDVQGVAEGVVVDERVAVDRVGRVDGDGPARERFLQDEEGVGVTRDGRGGDGGVVGGEGVGEEGELGGVAGHEGGFGVVVRGEVLEGEEFEGAGVGE